nr:MAG TPA_asm: hypothetical protein [Caudoviricetes sp.]
MRISDYLLLTKTNHLFSLSLLIYVIINKIPLRRIFI